MSELSDQDRRIVAVGNRWDRTAIWTSVAVFALTCLVALIVYSHGRGLREHYDDSYITYRYAVQLARGNGLVFNVGDRIDAASSFLYTVVLAAIYRVGIHDLEAAALVLGLASAGGIAVVVHRTSLRLTRCGWLSAAIGLLAGLHGLVSGWSVTGMETAFYAFLVTLAVGTGFLVDPCTLLDQPGRTVGRMDR